MLKEMNRRYTRETYLEKVAALRARIPDIGAHLRRDRGFPGETAEEFEDTMTLIDAVRFDALFTFIFSPGAPPPPKWTTPSPRRRRRPTSSAGGAAGPDFRGKHAAYIGKTVRCLVDGKDDKASPPAPPATGWCA